MENIEWKCGFKRKMGWENDERKNEWAMENATETETETRREIGTGNRGLHA